MSCPIIAQKTFSVKEVCWKLKIVKQGHIWVITELAMLFFWLAGHQNFEHIAVFWHVLMNDQGCNLLLLTLLIRHYYNFDRVMNKLNEHFLVCYIWSAFVDAGADNILYFCSCFGISHFLCCKAISVTNQLHEFSARIVVYSLILWFMNTKSAVHII